MCAKGWWIKVDDVIWRSQKQAHFTSKYDQDVLRYQKILLVAWYEERVKFVSIYLTCQKSKVEHQRFGGKLT